MKINELIKELCPNGVEWKTLGEVAKIERGDRITKKELVSDGKYPVMSGGTSFFGRYSASNRKANTITVAQYGSAGYVSFITEDFWANDVCYSVFPIDNIDNKYLYYCLLNNQSILYSLTTKAIPDCLPKERLESIQIPIPPIAIQTRIVEILDHFTNITANLNAELNLRRKQFEHYREKLLAFGEDVEWKKLGEVAEVTKLAGFEFTEYVKYSDTGNIIALRGLNVKNGNLNLDDVKYIDNSDFSKLNRSKLFINDMLFTYVGTVGQVALVDKNDKYYLAPNVALIRFKDENVCQFFMKYIFQSADFQKNQIDKYSGKSSMKNLTMVNIRKFKIPVPSLATQQSIVSSLDKFTALIANIEQEIALRQKQYEYYREELLRFERSTF